MRLQLIAAALFVPAAASAEEVSVHGKVSVYADDDATTVVSPRTRVTADPLERWSVSAGWAADVTTSASVDVMTAATPRAHAWEETRHEANASIGTVQGDVSASVGAVYSTEPDWDSIGVGGGGTIDFFERNFTLSARYALSLETVGRADDERFGRPLTVHVGEAGVTQVLSPSTIGGIFYTLTAADGYQQSPYRFVPVFLPGSVVVLPETHPSTRVRHAVTARANQHLFSDTAIQGDYRIYFDDWGVLSHTASARYLVHFAPSLTVRLRARAYLQSGASFYEDEYVSQDARVPTFVSRDRELSDLLGLLGGLKASWRFVSPGPFDWIDLDAKADVFRYEYAEFAELPERLGWIVEGGLAMGI